MEKERASSEYSWAWVTVDTILSHGPCELIFSHHVPSAAGTSTIDLYDGENTSGDLIIKCRTAESRATMFRPPKPIYCRRGLYVDIGKDIEGIFVQWRELGHKGGD